MQASPVRAISRRVLFALVALFAAVIIVYLDRDGYRDVQDNQLSFLDCLYYATVSLSTTGYGDITPFTPEARLINVLVITPLRVMFLIVLVGTTLEVLTERSRQALKIQRWRSKVRNHTVVVGYGTKGKTAVARDAGRRDQAVGDRRRRLPAGGPRRRRRGRARHRPRRRDTSDVLRLAGAQHAASIVIAANRDDTAVLATLTARELAPRAKIVASIREAENTHLIRQSGANSVVVSSETAGRLLGLATSTPAVVEVIEDLLTPDAGTPSPSVTSSATNTAPARSTSSTSSSASCVTAACTASTTARSMPSRTATACSMCARVPPDSHSDICPVGVAALVHTSHAAVEQGRAVGVAGRRPRSADPTAGLAVVVGRERIPSRGPVILVANHQAVSDSFHLAMAARRPVVFPRQGRVLRRPRDRRPVPAGVSSPPSARSPSTATVATRRPTR